MRFSAGFAVDGDTVATLFRGATRFGNGRLEAGGIKAAGDEDQSVLRSRSVRVAFRAGSDRHDHGIDVAGWIETGAPLELGESLDMAGLAFLSELRVELRRRQGMNIEAHHDRTVGGQSERFGRNRSHRGTGGTGKTRGKRGADADERNGGGGGDQAAGSVHIEDSLAFRRTGCDVSHEEITYSRLEKIHMARARHITPTDPSTRTDSPTPKNFEKSSARPSSAGRWRIRERA